MALLAMSLMVGLIFFVYNTGKYINRRLEMQNAADAVAISGAGWAARSMNVIAMNNCSQSRMLALVPVFDALPLATEMAAGEVAAWEEGLSGQLDRGLPPTGKDYLEMAVRSLHQRMARQKEILEALSDSLNSDSFDMRRTTHWVVEGQSGAPPHGSMWRTAVALEEFSYVTWQSSPELIQANAVRFGEANDADVAVLLPLTPMVPARVGEFEDFQPVIEGSVALRYDEATMRPTGRRGGGIPDFVDSHRLGPWAKLYKWLYVITDGESGVFVPDPEQPDEPQVIARGRGGTSTPGGRRTGSGVGIPTNRGVQGHWEGGWSEVIGWETYGPYTWALNMATGAARATVPDTFFDDYLRDLADAKLSYMFSPPQELVTRHYPDWAYVNDFPGAQAIGSPPEDDDSDQPVQRIHKTLYYRVEVYSSISPDSGNYMTPGTFITNADNPIAVWMNGWQDADNWSEYERVGNFVWRHRDEFEITVWPEIGIEATYTDAEGELEFHPVYVEIHYIWGGVDIGGEVEVRNPCNWDEYDQLPRPLIFYPGPNGQLDYRYNPDDSTRAVVYGFLGIVQKNVTADVWPSRFQDISPVDGVVTIAQAKLFNNTSWDLWTQDWQVQLMPIAVHKWDEWLEELDTGMWELDMVGGLVDEQEYNMLRDYLRNLNEEMVVLYFNH